MKKRVFWSFMLSSLPILVLTSALVITALYKDFTAERKSELVTQCKYIATALEKTDMDYLSAIGRESENRITLIASDGTVLYDNFAHASTLENHLDRPEVAAALKNKSGEATRLSDTLGERTYYYALLLDSGNVLRVSTTTKSIFGVINHTTLIFSLIFLLAMIIAVISARVLTRIIISPINRLNLDAPLSNNTYDELSPLLIRMDKQSRKISEQIAQLERKQSEFNAITDNMSEALVIFGENKHVLSANLSASKLFDNRHINNIGYLELCRDFSYINAVEAAFEGKPASNKMSRNGRIYQLSVTPVIGNNTHAAVLFAVDITEKEQNEKVRREFSANVSHELKTPLTSIMGCAEIMQNGIAKKEDYPHFFEQIYSESKRLLTLIEDIIKLSRLDEEGMKNEFMPVDLYETVAKAISELSNKAKAHGVEVKLEGSSQIVSGIEGTLHEMIYNLCDNAITYNKAGGSVDIKIESVDNNVLLTVRDTGIGIAAEHQARIFERFYRVDKSRSKETGGTGLGLSIVKHAAMLHNAQITLDSTPGLGTKITVKF